MRTSRSRRPGFTLVEMLAVMFLLAVVAGIMTLLLKDTLDLERGQRLGFDNLVRNHLLADQFRGDVAKAIRAPAKWRDYEANAHTLILQMSADSHVVYLCARKACAASISTRNKKPKSPWQWMVRRRTSRSLGDRFKRDGSKDDSPRANAIATRNAAARPDPGNRGCTGRRLAMIRHTIARRRQGVAIVMALVLMTVLTVVMSVVVMQMAAERRVLGDREQMLQADWLARSGVELAAARLLDDPAAFELERQDLLPDATVKITVEKSGTDEYRVTAEAAIGPDPRPKRARTALGHFRRVSNDGETRLTRPETTQP